MRWKEAADQYCSIARALGVLGDRWTLLIMREAFSGVRRFDDFRQHLGVARNVLTERLQRLVDAGVLERRAYQDNPPRHEYRLTEAGRDLNGVLLALMGWGDRWLTDGSGPPMQVVHRGCDQPITPALVCPDCGEPLTTRNTQLLAGPGLPVQTAKEREAEVERIRAQHAQSEQPSNTEA